MSHFQKRGVGGGTVQNGRGADFKKRPRNELRSTPTSQKVRPRILIARYPQITDWTVIYSNCGVSDLVCCDFLGGWGVFLKH